MNTPEPETKRRRGSTPPCLSVNSLPLVFRKMPDNKIAFKIFLLLDVDDLYQNCVIVSRAWHDFLTSDLLFLPLVLQREFGADKAKTLRRIPGALGGVKKCLLKNVVFRRRGQVLQAAPSRKIEWYKSEITSPDKFLRIVENQIGREKILETPFCFFGEKAAGDRWWLINVAKLVPCHEIFDVLKMPICFGSVDFGRSTFHLLESNPMKLIAFYDKNFNLLKQLHSDKGKSLPGVLLDYPLGMCYAIASGPLPAFTMRIFMTSVLDRVPEIEHRIRQPPAEDQAAPEAASIEY